MPLVKENTENELDLYPGVDDFDVSCGEFLEDSQPESSTFPAQSNEASLSECLDHGPTIVYVPTRKETVELANFLCKSGVRAAAYNAKMPKSHLRQVHQQFHCNDLEVVVATIAFGMGIDKSNVRRIIHYGFPQVSVAFSTLVLTSRCSFTVHVIVQPCLAKMHDKLFCSNSQRS